MFKTQATLGYDPKASLISNAVCCQMLHRSFPTKRGLIAIVMQTIQIQMEKQLWDEYGNIDMNQMLDGEHL